MVWRLQWDIGVRDGDPGGDVSCTATFTALYTLQVAKNGPGTVTSAPAGIACGDTCSATYTAGGLDPISWTG